MIIVFGNQKGGCGKTTNCAQFANYLAEQGKEVLVLDLDFQRSLVDRREEDIKLYDNAPKYEIMQAEIGEVAKIIRDFKDVDNGNLIIDLPGRIDNDALGVILNSANIIVCPFRYDKLTMDSTGFFIQIIKYLNVKAKIFFLPNNIRSSVRYETKEQVVSILSEIGTVTKEIPQSVLMERANTLLITEDCISLVKGAYDCIIEEGGIK